MSDPTVQRFTVEGMTCDHCVAAVKEELGRLPGVGSVRVELSSGEVEITTTELLDPAEVAAAVDEAGYELAGPPR